MADTLKVLGQSYPASSTETVLYTCAAPLGAAISSMAVCNQSSVVDTIRIAVAAGGASTQPGHYIYYNLDVPGNSTFVATTLISVSDTDVIRVYAANGTCSFSLFGIEDQ